MPALLTLIIGSACSGNIAGQVGELYKPGDFAARHGVPDFLPDDPACVIFAPFISAHLGEKVAWHYGSGCAGVVMVLGPADLPCPWLPPDTWPQAGTGSTSSLLSAPAAARSAHDRYPDHAVFAGLVSLPLMRAGDLANVHAVEGTGLSTCCEWSRQSHRRRFMSLLTNQMIFNVYLIWANEHHHLLQATAQPRGHRDGCRSQPRHAPRWSSRSGNGAERITESPTNSAK